MEYKLTTIIFMLIICLTHGHEKICLVKPEIIGDGVVLNKITHSTTTDTICALEGNQITINSSEEKSILDLCTSEEKSKINLLNVFNGAVNIPESPNFEAYCSGSVNLKIKLAWIPLVNFHEQPKLSGQTHIGKPSLDSVELCLVDFSASVPTCRTLGAEPQNLPVEDVVILVERIPSSFIIVDPTPSKWRNETEVKEINLGSNVIENGAPNAKFVQQNVPFAYEGQVYIKVIKPEVLNTKELTIDGDEYASKSLQQSQYYVYSTNRTYPVITPVDAYSKLNVTLYGTWVKIQSTLSGKLAGVYDPTSKPEPLADVILERVDVEVKYIKPFFGKMEPFSPFVTTVVIPTEKPGENNFKPGSSLPHASGGHNVVYQDPKPDGIYPGFRPYFMIACTIISTVLISVIFDVTRKCIRDRRSKRDRSDVLHIQPLLSKSVD